MRSPKGPAAGIVFMPLFYINLTVLAKEAKIAW
jgi:hypothetical protein